MPKSVKAISPSVGPIDPDNAVLDLHADGDINSKILIFAKLLGDTAYRLTRWTC